jgi:hypothetical protein
MRVTGTAIVVSDHIKSSVFNESQPHFFVCDYGLHL